ncbi:AsmA family protein [Pseudodonghicola flavimaris]|uniref:AsmA family protein n=1 Tax=Pseudodonghicola flavimaris TaxID=3050036 RepID=A0ABT7EYS9_9RHOB|nr:AsmA family protein [Pseudodonghicola flavimaris]MDK3017507.1 AsmA family protein [Pseudodonghicola flavimaris]
MKWALRALAGIVVLAAVMVVALLMLPAERIARIAAQQVEARTGRALTITGDLHLSFWPVLGIETGPVTLANADWAGDEPMFRATSLSIGVGVSELIGGKIRITRLVAEDPMLDLRTGADGRGNWELTTPVQATGTSAPAASAGGATALTLDEVQLKGAEVSYTASGAAPMRLGPVDVKLAWPDATGPADLHLALTSGGQPFDMTMRIDSLEAFLAGQTTALALNAKGAGGDLSFEGQVNNSGALSGAVSARSDDPVTVLEALGGPSDLPPALRSRAEVEGRVSYGADGRLSLRDLALTAAGNSLSGAADLDLSGKRPQISADFSAGALDLSGFMETGSTGGGQSAGSTGSGWSTAPIDASALGLADGQLHLSAQSIALGDWALGPTTAAVTLNKSRAVLDLAPATIFGGSLSGRMVANNRKGFSVSADLTASDLQTEALLTTLAGTDRLSGKLQAQISVLGAGRSVDAIMRSLSGSGQIRMGRGVISGIDLDKLFRSGAVTKGTTVFDSLTASYKIQKGNLQNDDLLLSLSSFRVEGQGRIGLGARDLNYLVTPVAFKGGESEGLRLPLRVTGPWSGPKIAPDLEAAAGSKLDEQKDALEQKLRDKLQVEDGKTTEDALKDKLESEARKGILKLLGGN